MPLPFVRALIVLSISAAVTAQSSPAGQPSPIVGAWVLNPALTERPQEIGFSHDWARAGAEEGGRSGGRGRRGGSGGGAAASPQMPRESIDDATRLDQLTGEARTPPSRLTIIQKTDSVSIADDQGHSRTYHPSGRLEELTLGTVALPTTARWDGTSLIVTYDVESGRQLRYTYTPAATPTRLLVNIRFLERGREGDEVRLTYEPPDAHARAVLSDAPPAAAPSAAPPSPSAPPSRDPSAPAARPRVLPPGSELRGLTTIGTVVEEIGPQGVACGLDQAKLKATAARILADAGFKTERFGNEDTYVLVSTVTSRLPDGMCVSRYDASLIAQADATFPYLDGLVAVPVQLLHEGGMAGGSPAAHAKSVTDALVASINRFVGQIRATNK
jgi:hypothetical protein